MCDVSACTWRIFTIPCSLWLSYTYDHYKFKICKFAMHNKTFDLLSTRKEQRLLLKSYSIEKKTLTAARRPWKDPQDMLLHASGTTLVSVIRLSELCFGTLRPNSGFIFTPVTGCLEDGVVNQNLREKNFPSGSWLLIRRIDTARDLFTPDRLYLVKLSTKAECQRVQSLSRLLAAGVLCP